MYLTDVGKSIRENLTAIALKVQNKLFIGITKNEARVMEEILNKINQNLNSTNNI